MTEIEKVVPNSYECITIINIHVKKLLLTNEKYDSAPPGDCMRSLTDGDGNVCLMQIHTQAQI